MARTITALFDTRADADAGGERLRQAGVDASHINVHDQSTHKTAGPQSTRKDAGLWGSIKNAFLPDEDRHTYEEGIRRGGFLLTADLDDNNIAAAVKSLEEANTIDLDARSQEWRSQGWDYQSAAESNELDEDLSPYGVRDREHGSSRYRTYTVDRDRG